MVTNVDIRDKLMHTNGTTALETISVIVPSFFYTFVTVLLGSLLHTFATRNKVWQFLLEFIVLVLPITLNVTLLPKYTSDILVSSFIVITSLVIIIRNLKDSINLEQSKSQDSRKYFITNARSTINIISVIAILAVDFQVFPRRFAKTETFGFSLMDVGVGLFMYSNGLIAPEVRGLKDSVTKSLKSSIPLLMLGSARFFVTKKTDYHVPITEYGVHWNFFITLAFTKVATSLIMNVVDVKYVIVNAVLLICSHEIFLQAGLKNLVLSETKRDSFISANKEGLVSSLGYISLYLFSVYFGYLLNIKNCRSRYQNSLRFILGSLITIFLTFTLRNSFGISRRLANSAYCFWILFIGIFMTGLFYAAEIIQQSIFRNKLGTCVYSPYIFEAINYNGLTFFLLSNIVTGLINVSINTLDMSNVSGFFIISTYMLVNCSIICYIFYRQIKLKL